MLRVSSLTNLSDRQLDRLIRRVALLAVVVLVGFVAFYVYDRYRPPQAPIVDREVASLEAAVRADPSDIVSRGRLADLYTVKGLYTEAIAQYDQILETGQADVQAHYGRGEANRLSGQLDAATADYQAVVDALASGEQANVDPTLEAAYFGLGTVSLAQGRPQDAVGQLEKAKAIKPADADVLNLLGSAYLATGEPTKAIEALKQAIAFVPFGWADPYATLAAAYTKTGDAAHAEWAGAMADFSNGLTADATTRLQALVDGPAALDAAVGLAVIAETQGDLATATRWYQQALTIDPNDDAAKLGLTRVSANDSDPHGAASPMSSAIPSLPQPGDLQEGQP